jgi:hypothetical protein
MQTKENSFSNYTVDNLMIELQKSNYIVFYFAPGCYNVLILANIIAVMSFGEL